VAAASTRRRASSSSTPLARASLARASTTTVARVSRALDAIDVAIDARRRAFEWAPPDDDARGRPVARSTKP
jgi:hypothetical protein